MPDKPHWAKDLTSSGLHYFKGIASYVEGILEKHRRETHCTFGTRTSKKFELGGRVLYPPNRKGELSTK